MIQFGSYLTCVLYLRNMKKSLLTIALATTLSLQGCSNLVFIEKPDSEKLVEEFYTEATEAFEEKQWDAAIKSYEKLKAYYPYGGYAEQSYLELAYSYYKYDEPESAIRELEEFIKVFPKHKELPYAYYLKALAADSVTTSWLDTFITDAAQRDTKSTQRTFNFYQEVIQRFPKSKYAPKAQERLVIIRNRMARHEFQVAKFYFKKKAYLASANRCRTVIEEYPRAIINMEALELMKQNYALLGMTQNYTDTLKVIEHNQQLIEEKRKNTPETESWWSKAGDTIGNLFD